MLNTAINNRANRQDVPCQPLWICQWCGASGTSEEFDVEKNNEGFWCPDCDSYTTFRPEDDKRRMLLLLEKKCAFRTRMPVPLKDIKLRKRLSPLRYPGGKSKVIDQIYHRLDQEQLDTFVEVFAGGASLGLSLLDANIVQKLVLNDLDPWVGNFWMVATQPNLCRELMDCIETRELTWEIYNAARRHVFNDNTGRRHGLGAVDKDAVENAFSFLILNRLNFGGIQTAGPICGKHGDLTQLRQRWNIQMLVKRLSRILELSPHITVSQQDVVSLLVETAGWLSRATLFFDPPYITAGPRLYRESFSNRHGELADVLNEFYRCWPGPDLILTYDDCPQIRSIYPFAQVEYLQTAWSITH